MKPTFHHRAVNGPFEDPGIYVRFLREKRAALFDAGSLDGLSQGDLLKITDVFISHTHIDHFIGFDTVLRALLRRVTPLRVFGPSGITDCIEGKLRGYTWNLIEEYPLSLEVFALNGDTLRQTSFYARERFKRHDGGESTYSGIILKEASFTVRAVSLAHDIQCLGFSLEEDFHININKAALSDMGLPVGPWLGEFKQAIRENMPEESEFHVSGKSYRLGELRHLAMITKGQKISYIADSSPDEENVQKIIDLARGADTLYCEAYFLDEDMDRARDRNHLTARLAGRIAREAGAKTLVPIHFSPRYIYSPFSPEQEALEEFTRG